MDTDREEIRDGWTETAGKDEDVKEDKCLQNPSTPLLFFHPEKAEV